MVWWGDNDDRNHCSALRSRTSGSRIDGRIAVMKLWSNIRCAVGGGQRLSGIVGRAARFSIFWVPCNDLNLAGLHIFNAQKERIHKAIAIR